MRFAYMSLKNKGVFGFCGRDWEAEEAREESILNIQIQDLSL